MPTNKNIGAFEGGAFNFKTPDSHYIQPVGKKGERVKYKPTGNQPSLTDNIPADVSRSVGEPDKARLKLRAYRDRRTVAGRVRPASLVIED